MPENPNHPFQHYLDAIDRQLRDLPLIKRQTIRRELLAHLEDAAAEQDANPDDAAVQQAVITALGPAPQLAAQYAQVHAGLARLLRRLGFSAGLLGVVSGLVAAPFTGNALLHLLIDMLPILGAGTLGWLIALGTVLLSMTAAGLGLVGVLREDRQQPGSTWRVLLAVVVLLSSGMLVFYQGDDSLSLPGGLALMLAGELLLVNLALRPAILSMSRPQLLAVAALMLGLISFVAPFSYLPNPLGLAQLLTFGMSYRPGLPFFNGFATLGKNPIPPVQRRLDALIGQTGLDPLDPEQPLSSYTLDSVYVYPFVSGMQTTLDVTLHYADASSRSVRIPVIQYGDTPLVELTGIDRLSMQHLALGAIPFAKQNAPIRLGTPARLTFDAQTELPWDAHMQYDGGGPLDSVHWTPDGQGFVLLISGATSDKNGLWLISRDGRAPQKLTTADVARVVWSADAQSLIFADTALYIHVLNRHNGKQEPLHAEKVKDFAVNGQDVYMLIDNHIVRQSLAGQPAQILSLPYVRSAPLLSPDQQRMAYQCDAAICLADSDGTHLQSIVLGYQSLTLYEQFASGQPGPVPTGLPLPSSTPLVPQQATVPALESSELLPTSVPLPPELATAPHLESMRMAWSHDGRLLAVTTGSRPGGIAGSTPAYLWLISRDGQLKQTIAIAPDNITAAPQWSTTDRFVLINTFPQGGRRIIAVEASSGQAYDLSQPRWDAFFSLTPDGREMLLWNGRGSVWIAPLEEQP